MKKYLFYLSLFLLVAPLICRAESLNINTTDGNEISVERFSAEGTQLFIWLPHEASPQSVDVKLAAEVAKLGVEVWLADLFTANFLPVAASSMEQIPPEQITALIDRAISTGKQVFLLSSGRGAVPMLRGARHWQQQHPTAQQLAGVILLSPKLFVETPDPGLEGELMPVTTATNLPVYILQSALSPWFWKLPKVVSALEEGGSEVYVQRLAKVRDRFYFRPDADGQEKSLADKLPGLLTQAAWLLQQLPARDRQAVAKAITTPAVRSSKKDLRLQAYKGNPQPPALVLDSLAGKKIDLKDLRGQVVLVNFWASWCPPCVHEMPSMARLMDSYKGKPFTILAVNMAEDQATIQQFIKTKVKVNYPIVLDKDGQALRTWKVFAFPTSYLIDRHGVIRFAVFGSIDWDSREIMSTINTLIKEKP